MKKVVAKALLLIAMTMAAPMMTVQASERISINLASRILMLYQDGEKSRIYHICAGKVETPTPVGSFEITCMEVDPAWVDPKDHKKRVAPGEGNPLGQRWMGLFDLYGIHGTNNPASIGGYCSNGCIRMYEEDAEELYDKVDVGTRVDIFYDRLVIEKIKGGAVAYYIYPDGYGRQPLDVEDVREALDAYGLGFFPTNEEIEEKIDAEDGEPTFLPRVFRIEIDDLWVSGKAVVTADGETYLPVQSLSRVTKFDYAWDEKKASVRTDLGQAAGKKFGRMIYVRLFDAKKLFDLTGGFDEKRVMKLSTKSVKTVPVQAAEPGQEAVPARADHDVVRNARETHPKRSARGRNGMEAENMTHVGRGMAGLVQQGKTK